MSAFASLDEAARYVDMKRAGCVTTHDDVPALDLVASLYDLLDSAINAAVDEACAAHEAEVQTVEETGASSERESLLGDPDALAEASSVVFLMRALASAIERERAEALEVLAKEMTAMRDRLTADRDLLQKQVTGALAPKQRKPRRVKSAGEGTQT